MDRLPMFPQLKKPKKLIYLDHAATTPLDPEVKKAMAPFFIEKFGNPSSLYEKGREAKDAIDRSRTTIAKLINARPSEIVFTAGGTESVNLAIFGVAKKQKKPAHFITSTIEHHCVLNSFDALAGEGHKTTFVGVDRDGVISIDKLKKSVRPQTVLISVMLANNEIGTIQPLEEIGKWLKGLNQQRLKKHLPQIIFHTDACQAPGFLSLDVNRLAVDLMSVNGSKMYGPKQTGFLYVRSGINLKPLIYGGGQENNLRSGTQNVPGVVGLAKAFELAQKNQQKESKRLSGLRDYFITKVVKQIPSTFLNGPRNRLPNNINLTFKGVDGEALMLYLDSYGIACSTASACSTGTLDPSHVLLAIGRSENETKSSIRFSLGKATSKAELDYLLKLLPSIVKEIQAMQGLK